MRIFLLFLLVALSSQCGWPTTILQSEQGAFVLQKKLEKDKPVVLIFFDSECPICQKYTKNIRELSVQFSDIQWIGIFTRWNSPEQIAAYKREYGLDIPMYLDAQNSLVHQLNVKVTPEVVFVTPKQKILYQGAIDNWFFSLGKHRPAATENYLIDAIEAWGRGEAPKISRTTSIGCVIER